MSAFLLPNSHINALLSFAKYRLPNGRLLRCANGHKYNLNDKDVFNLLGNDLREANEESLLYRYNDHRRSFEAEFKENPYVAKEVYTGDYREEDIIQAISCYHYQSCEHPLYETRDAYFIVEAIKQLAVDSLVEGKSDVWVIGDDS